MFTGKQKKNWTQTIPEEAQILKLLVKDIKSTVLKMLGELKGTMDKKLKEIKRTM